MEVTHTGDELWSWVHYEPRTRCLARRVLVTTKARREENGHARGEDQRGTCSNVIELAFSFQMRKQASPDAEHNGTTNSERQSNAVNIPCHDYPSKHPRCSKVMNRPSISIHHSMPKTTKA
jgi:hypothetical protein